VGDLAKLESLYPARLEVQSISISYGGVRVVENLSLQVGQGERVAIVGPNGAGKSTFFKALAGLKPVQEGQILIHGKPLGTHKDCVAYIPQREEVDWRFPVTVQDVVMMGRLGHIGWIKPAAKRDIEIASTCMEELGIAKLAKKPISDLSGGQQQRVFLARALAQEPHILLMDEPFSGIDITTQEILFHLLDQLREQHVTVIVSTHDLNMAAQRFDKVLLLKHRLVAFGSARDVFTPTAIREAFGSQVLYLDNAVVVDDCCPADEHNHNHEDP